LEMNVMHTKTREKAQRKDGRRESTEGKRERKQRRKERKGREGDKEKSFKGH